MFLASVNRDIVQYVVGHSKQVKVFTNRIDFVLHLQTFKDTMLFKLEEIFKWIGITAFEVWLHLVSVFVFSFLAVFKYEDLIQCTWYEAFIPLFICDGLCAYFVIIVYIRMYRDRSSVIRLLSSLLSVVLLFVFKVLLCQKLSKEKIITYSEVMVPLFALVVIVMFRSCHNNS